MVCSFAERFGNGRIQGVECRCAERRKIRITSLGRTVDMPNLMRTSNPALNEKAFQGQVALGEAMTLQGTVNKTGLLLLCVVATAAWTWGLSHSNTPAAAIPWMIGGLFGGFVVALVTIFKKEWSQSPPPFTPSSKAWRWAASLPCFELRYPGIAIQA